MKTLGNILWIVAGGGLTAIEYFALGLLSCLTIIGIPFGLQLFKLGKMMLFPFGATITRDSSTFGCLGNALWFLLGGFLVCLSHLAVGCILCLTVIGIPFGLKHFQFAILATAPFDVRIELAP